MKKTEDTAQEFERPYVLSESLYPIIVPNMNVKDLSVCVLFHEHHLELTETVPADKRNLMVVYSPTFSYLCETCFLLPTVFHEIAHHFRYEDRSERNYCLEKFVLKGWILNILRQILDESGKYSLVKETDVSGIVDKIYQCLDKKLLDDAVREKGLHYYTYRLKAAVNEFVAAGNAMNETPADVIRSYMDKTKGCVRKYTDEVLTAIMEIDKCLCEMDDLLHIEEDLMAKLRNLLKKFEKLQEIQICDEIESILNKSAIEFNGKGYVDSDLKGFVLFQIWNDMEQSMSDTQVRRDLKTLLKQYHNVVKVYNECDRLLSRKLPGNQIYYQKLISVMSQQMYDNILDTLEKFEYDRDETLNWNTIAMSSEQLEYIRKKIKIEKKEGMDKKIQSIFSAYSEEMVADYVDSKIKYYREVTSDLFMCAAMGLMAFGYLVIAAENFVFRKNNKDALYKRISIVLQCLIAKDSGNDLDSEIYDQKLTNILRREIDVLQEQSDFAREIFRGWAEGGADLDTLAGIFNELRDKEKPDMTSTQRWIWRIYHQIAVIVNNITGVRLAYEEIGEKEIWDDLISEQSYLGKKEYLNDNLKKAGNGLCENISLILNSPATYYRKKKSLVLDEIGFILQHYEGG